MEYPDRSKDQRYWPFLWFFLLLFHLFSAYGPFKMMMTFFLNDLVASSALLSKKDLIGFFANKHRRASGRKESRSL